jgi:hypothetical protein
VAFRFIAAVSHPDHDPLSTFRRRFLSELDGLFVLVLELAHEMKSLKLGTIRLDSTDGDVSECGPVHLALHPREGVQAQTGLAALAWTVAADQVAKVIWTTLIAALTHHLVQTAGGQCRKLLQRLANEWKVAINLRRTVPACTCNCRAMVPARHFSTW